VNLRPYLQEDLEAVASVYRDAVTGLGPQGYDAAQVAVWASFAEDRRTFGDRLADGLTVVAEDEEGVAAFGQLHPAGHIEFLYCAPRAARRGFATAIYAWLELQALQSGDFALTTDASRVSRPFFEKMGFDVVEAEYVERSGVTLERFRMRKELR